MTDFETGVPFDAKQRATIDDIVSKAYLNVVAWAEVTRPSLSEPDPGYEWRLHVGFPSLEMDESNEMTVTFPHEWLLVRVESAP